ncbi:MAG: hypothetical protein FWC73_01640 [Defluviitaleaceae bacterium]|nr:hypothetical protein [Defluviitaleaceae bacterium]
MNYFAHNIEVLVDVKHYDASAFQDVITINEDDYLSLYCHSAKFSICSSPACLDLGQISILSSIVIYETASNKILIGVLVNAIYDLMKYISSKIPSILLSRKHQLNNVPVVCTLDVKHEEATNVKVNLSFSSEELKEMSNGLKQLNKTISELDIKGEIQIQYESSKWHITN